MKRFKNKVVVITGGAVGIGYVMAELFGREGAQVFILDVSPEKGNTAEWSLISDGIEAAFIQCDVTKKEDIEQAVLGISDKVAAVHVLCNNAGLELTKPINDITEHEWDTVSAVNVKGTFLVTQLFLPLLKKAGGAAVVNTSSISGLIGWPNSAAYCSAKGGVIMLSKQLSVDLAKDHIRVNCICPGTTETPMLDRLLSLEQDKEQAAERIAERHLLKRFAKPEEIAQAALFLSSEDASYVTGAVLPVDGGYTAK